MRATYGGLGGGTFTVTFEGTYSELCAIRDQINESEELRVDLRLKLESCLRCKGPMKAPRKSTRAGDWIFFCPMCTTRVILRANCREEAIDYYNEGVRKC